jgi:hypothetical protein
MHIGGLQQGENGCKNQGFIVFYTLISIFKNLHKQYSRTPLSQTAKGNKKKFEMDLK